MLDALREHGAVVLHAPTGAGKTTRVPPALLDTIPGLIIVVQPRVVAARAAARRMAQERGERVGETIGYQVRLDSKRSARTRVLVVTTGILLRRIIGDPFLEDVSAVVLDEVHERSVDADLALALVAQIRRDVRDDLAVVAMSATADTESMSSFLDAPVLRSEGRTFPVEVRYAPRIDSREPTLQAAEAARELLEETGGDVLVFLPGVREIDRTAAALSGVKHAEVLPLHGRLPPAAQDRALSPGERPRIVLATNVAETSVTLPGVRGVVDTGLVRQLTLDHRRGLDRLVTVQTSRASADQRAGRAGRVAPGVCRRLWTERAHQARSATDAPEIERVSLEGVVLTLLSTGEPDPRQFRWLQAPPPNALDHAWRLLQDLGAVHNGRLTPLGERMAAIPASPRLARVVLEGAKLGVVQAAAMTAALLSERLVFRRDRTPRRSHSDIADLLAAIDNDGAGGWRAVNRGAVRRLRQTSQQLLRAAPRNGPRQEDGLSRAIVSGFPDRVAMRRPDGRYLMANGRGAVPGPTTAVRDVPCVVVLDVADHAGSEARIHLAAEADTSWLPSTEAIEVAWDQERDRVIAARVQRYRALVLHRQEGVPAPPEQVVEALMEAAARFPTRIFPHDDKDAARLLARLRFVARVRPTMDWPSVTEASLIERIPTLAPTARSLQDVRRADWTGTLLGEMPWSTRQQLDSLAPESIRVPSGRRIRLRWPTEGPPVLAVRMQEMFGCTETPCVAGVPVLLHLLAPNQRPQQITDDLAGFWSRTWPSVRKELRARYPRHAWPEDPTNATAESRPRRRS